MAPTKIIKTSHYNSTTETLKSVPTEMILEILLRLPVESLLRCKSVCKLWFSLISDSHFVKSHLKLSTANNDQSHCQLLWIRNIFKLSLKSCRVNDVLLDKSIINVVDHAYPLNFRSKRVDIAIVGSCNGLICIVDDHFTAFICNPSTRMWNQLPSPGFERRSVVYGFGYDDLTDDYKVVGIAFGWKRETKMFSLKSGKWKNIVDGIPKGTRLSSLEPVFSNGSIHWTAQDSKSSSDHFAIVALDLEKETYGQVAPPVYDFDHDDVRLRLGVLGDSLCLLCNYPGDRADVWVMKVYGVKDSWTKLVSIPYLTAQLTMTGITMPLCISNDGKVLLQLSKKLVVYDSKNKSFPEIHNFGACEEVCNFVQSLVSPSTATGLADNNADQK